MKRHSGREHSPKIKRSRHSHSPELSPHNVFDRYSHIDNVSQKNRLRHSPSPSLHENGNRRATNNLGSIRETYKSLCVSSLPPKVSESQVKDAIQQNYSKFGDLNIKFATYNNERVAYINFKHSDIAQKARHSVLRFTIGDRPVRVEPVCSARNRSPTPRGAVAEGGSSRPSRNNNNNSHADNSHSINERPDSPPTPSGSRHDDSFERGSSSSKREPKFPHHLDHKDPSEDPTATRTLFVGNLYYEINEAEIRDIFEPYGIVEDIDIKRPTKGAGNAYAFIKYWNLDMAHRAKIAMSGKVVKNFQCKIGYGKANPTRCIWVGGLGPWIQFDSLQQEFSTFGDIEEIEWPQGKNYAYILYVQVDSAMKACNDMRGRSLSNTENKLRIDFAEPEHIHKDPLVRRRTTSTIATVASVVTATSSANNLSSSSQQQQPPQRHSSGGGGGDESLSRHRTSRDREDKSLLGNRLNRKETRSISRDSCPDDRHPQSTHHHPPQQQQQQHHHHHHQHHHHQLQPQQQQQQQQPHGVIRGSHRSSSRANSHEKPTVLTSRTINELTSCLAPMWTGWYVLKSCLFASTMYLLHGNSSLINEFLISHDVVDFPSTPASASSSSLLGNHHLSTEKKQVIVTKRLNITQRLPLEPSKTEDLQERMNVCGDDNLCVMIATNPVDKIISNDPNETTRQFKGLVTYFLRKAAAGVVFLQGSNESCPGVLHCFPPSEFSRDLLCQNAPALNFDRLKSDYLVVVLIRNVSIS